MLVSMSDLFPVCVEVLRKELRPLYYRTLTETALALLGVTLIPEEFRKVAEDVREKLLEARGYGTFYTGRPRFAGALTEWWHVGPCQGDLYEQHEGILIPGSAQCGIDACFESVMRQRYFLTKVADTEARWRAMARGQVVERHVSNWFRARWSGCWLPPDNYRLYTLPCDHDFKLSLGGRVFNIDVAGPRWDETFGTSRGKSPAAYHLLARPEGRDVRLLGYLPGRLFTDEVSLSAVRPVTRLLVQLNAVTDGYNLNDLHKAACGRRVLLHRQPV